KIVYNQPAGHVERGETLLEAAKRETLEETGWEVEISGFLGIYHYTAEKSGICYVRHSFIGKKLFHREDYKLDEDIIDTCWMSLNKAETLSKHMRTPLVLKTLYDFNERNHYPISQISSQCLDKPSHGF
ncbi:MAG: NUDIX hydrolase, partial [Gammaproteobacteria bacterium]|nr:NUDIX hydrolase [Gammaproteobacteria bacterium]